MCWVMCFQRIYEKARLTLRANAAFVISGSLLLSACGGAGTTDPPAPTVPPPPPPPPPPSLAEQTSDTSTGTVTLNGTSGALLISARNVFLSDQIITDAVVSFNNDTDELSIQFSQTISGGGLLDVDFSVGTADADSLIDGIYRASGQTADGIRTVVIAYVVPGEFLPALGTSLDWVTGGAWVSIENASGLIDVGGGIVAGIVTEDMPATGSASYDSTADAIVVTGGVLTEVLGLGTITANFGSGSLDGNFSTFNLLDANGSVVDTVPGFSLTGSITNGPEFSGTTARQATATEPQLSGIFSGNFYGPGAAEIGGIFNLSSGGTDIFNDTNIVGGFLGKKQ